MAENQAKQSQKERLKEITDSIETGIKEMFASDKYKTYLQTMSRFHKYSFNNTMLIAMQKPDATLVAGFNKWKNSFGRNVMKGEKGIKIIAPVPYKVKEEVEKIDPVTKAPLLDKNGKVQIEEVERQIPMFRVVSVFDVSQTEGKEIPSLVNDIAGNVEHFEVFMEALKRTSIVPIEIMPITNGADGYYHLEDKRIAIREGMSEIQTISATIHEMAHSKLHDKALLDDKGEPIKKDRNTEEVEAESISYAVCNYYGIETSDNSFGYIANWSKGKELKELKSSLELIGKTSSELITDIDKAFAELVKERGIDLTKEVEPVAVVDPVLQLATEVDSFTREYDPHGYRDNVGSSDEHIAEIMDNLRIGKIAEMREYLTDVGDLDGNDTKKAFDLIVKIDEFADSTYPQELAYKIDDYYISIFTVDDGYDYSILDKDYNLLDGGQLDNPNLTIYEALNEVSEGESNFPFTLVEGIEKVDFTELTDKADEVESEKIKAIKFEQGLTEDKPTYNPIVDLSDIKREILEDYTPEDLDFLQSYLDTVLLKYNLTGNQISDFVIEGMANNDFNFKDLREIEKSDFAQAVALDSKSMIADKIVREHSTGEVETAYFMPDNTVSMADAQAYGYTTDELLPLTKERAIDLYNEDLTIFALYPDNTEAMVFGIDEFDSHAGYFGIEKADWENFYEFKEQQALENGLTPLEEQAFLENTGDCFAIFQIKEGAEFRDYRFTGSKELESMGKEVDRDNYNFIYTDSLQNVTSANTALNGIYHVFNNERPDDFKGHSLSVSDIVAIKLNGVVSSHYVDSFGFKEIPNYLKSAELSAEQNYNQIDGVINNEPIVGKIEYLDNSGVVVETMEYTDKERFDEQVREDNYYGVPISITVYDNKSDLSVENFDPPLFGFIAEKTEKKSVLAELKAKPEQTEQNDKPKTKNKKEMER